LWGVPRKSQRRVNSSPPAASSDGTMMFPDHPQGPRRSRKSRKTRAMPFAAPVAPLLRKFGLRKTIEIDAAPSRRAGDAPSDDAPVIEPAVALLIDEIRAYNPSAPSAFLATFTRRDLENYLEHLGSAKEPRGRTARWVRPG